LKTKQRDTRIEPKTNPKRTRRTQNEPRRHTRSLLSGVWQPRRSPRDCPALALPGDSAFTALPMRDLPLQESIEETFLRMLASAAAVREIVIHSRSIARHYTRRLFETLGTSGKFAGKSGYCLPRRCPVTVPFNSRGVDWDLVSLIMETKLLPGDNTCTPRTLYLFQPL
jgi:hypothetical protein